MNTVKYGDNVVMKEDMEEIKEHSAVFANGSEEEIDTIIYCTGQLKMYNFLAISRHYLLIRYFTTH